MQRVGGSISLCQHTESQEGRADKDFASALKKWLEAISMAYRRLFRCQSFSSEYAKENKWGSLVSLWEVVCSSMDALLRNSVPDSVTLQLLACLLEAALEKLPKELEGIQAYCRMDATGCMQRVVRACPLNGAAKASENDFALDLQRPTEELLLGKVKAWERLEPKEQRKRGADGFVRVEAVRTPGPLTEHQKETKKRDKSLALGFQFETSISQPLIQDDPIVVSSSVDHTPGPLVEKRARLESAPVEEKKASPGKKGPIALLPNDSGKAAGESFPPLKSLGEDELVRARACITVLRDISLSSLNPESLSELQSALAQLHQQVFNALLNKIRP